MRIGNNRLNVNEYFELLWSVENISEGASYLDKGNLRAAAHQLRQDKHQDMRQKKQKLTSAS
jgi:hypothetical protein